MVYSRPRESDEAGNWQNPCIPRPNIRPAGTNIYEQRADCEHRCNRGTQGVCGRDRERTWILIGAAVCQAKKSAALRLMAASISQNASRTHRPARNLRRSVNELFIYQGYEFHECKQTFLRPDSSTHAECPGWITRSQVAQPGRQSRSGQEGSLSKVVANRCDGAIRYENAVFQGRPTASRLNM